MATDKKRGTEVVSDMLRSLAVVVVVIAPLWFIIPHHAKQTVTVIDYSTPLSQARRLSDQAVLAPQGLPDSWRATSVAASGGNGTPVVFHLGYVTPDNQYAALEESTGPSAGYLLSLEGKAPQRLGPVQVGAQTWQQLSGSDHRLGLVSVRPGLTLVVKGTAALAELTTLAASVH